MASSAVEAGPCMLQLGAAPDVSSAVPAGPAMLQLEDAKPSQETKSEIEHGASSMLDAILARAAKAKATKPVAPPAIADLPPAKKPKVGMATKPVAPPAAIADLPTPAKKRVGASMSHEQSRCQFLVRLPNAPSTKFRYGGAHANYSNEAEAKKAATAFLGQHSNA